MTLKAMAYHAAHRLSRTLPPRVALGFAERLSDVQWRCSAMDRAAVTANLRTILNDRPVPEASVREVFRHFGRYLVEFFRMGSRPAPDVEVSGREHLEAAHRNGRGAIVLTAHLGNWELGAATIRALGFPLTAISLPYEDEAMGTLFNGRRAACGVRVIPTGDGAARAGLKVLRAGHVLGVLGDREFGRNGIVLPIFGASMVFPQGPALLSRRSGAALVPAFLVRQGPWQFRLCFEPPIRPEEQGERHTATERMMAAYAVVLERYVRAHAEQWLLFRPVFGPSLVALEEHAVQGAVA